MVVRVSSRRCAALSTASPQPKCKMEMQVCQPLRTNPPLGMLPISWNGAKFFSIVKHSNKSGFWNQIRVLRFP